jgi:hypothetical protein
MDNYIEQFGRLKRWLERIENQNIGQIDYEDYL